VIRRIPTSSTSSTSPPRTPLAGLLAGAFLATPAGALAAETAATPGIPLATMLQTVAGLALILGLFVGAAWIARRLAPGGLVRRDGATLRIVDMLPLSPRERILVIEVEDTWLVVAVGPGQMRTLHTMPKGSLPTATPHGPAFGHWLQRYRKADHGPQ